MMRFVLIVWLISLAFASQSHAQTAYWGGVSFTSFAETKAEQRERFPFASNMFRCDPCAFGNINTIARERLAENPYDNIDVSLDAVGSRQLEGLILTPLIARESVIIAEDIDPDGTVNYEYAMRFFINLMLFEFKQGEGRFSGSFPFIFKHVETSKTPLSQDQLMNIAAELYGSNTKGMNIFDELYKQAKSKLTFKGFSSKYPQITEISLSDEVAGVMGAHVDLDAFAAQTGQIFEANLVKQSGGMLIPTLGDNNNNEMEAVFQDAARRIQLPEPAASILLDVNRFVYWEKVKGAQKTVCFIVLVNVKVNTTFDTIMDTSFVRKKESCGVIRTVEKLTPHFQFPEQLYSLLYPISQQFDGSVDAAFLSTAAPKHPQAADQIKLATEKLFAAF